MCTSKHFLKSDLDCILPCGDPQSNNKPALFFLSYFLLFADVEFSSYRNMETAIKTVVTTFVKSAGGKDSLDSKSFQKLIQKQLGGIMEVRLYTRFFFFWYTSSLSVYKIMQSCFNLAKSGSVRLLSIQDANKSSAIKEMQKGLDENNDGKVGFQEYLTLIGYVANSLSESQCASKATASQTHRPPWAPQTKTPSVPNFETFHLQFIPCLCQKSVIILLICKLLRATCQNIPTFDLLYCQLCIKLLTTCLL